MNISPSDVVHDGKRYTKDEWEKIQHAMTMVDHYDLLQLTKKIQL